MTLSENILECQYLFVLFQGLDGVKNLSGVFSAYFQKGGMQFQPNVINREILLDAYNHPEKYPYLLVRIAGYCADTARSADVADRVLGRVVLGSHNVADRAELPVLL